MGSSNEGRGGSHMCSTSGFLEIYKNWKEGHVPKVGCSESETLKLEGNRITLSERSGRHVRRLSWFSSPNHSRRLGESLKMGDETNDSRTGGKTCSKLQELLLWYQTKGHGFYKRMVTAVEKMGPLLPASVEQGHRNTNSFSLRHLRGKVMLELFCDYQGQLVQTGPQSQVPHISSSLGIVWEQPSDQNCIPFSVPARIATVQH